MGPCTAAASGGHVREALDALVAADGSAAHPFVIRLGASSVRGVGLVEVSNAAHRDLADAVHGLCAIHGTHPGMADEAAAEEPGASWRGAVAAAFAGERQFLARTVSAAGPLPSTPGQAATDAAFAAQRHAFRMLARSGRAGVATGAVAALALDWIAVRDVLGRAAEAFGVAPAPLALPSADETAAVLDAADGPAAERALLFGARALLDQHRAFWSLLEARAAARD